MSFLHSDHLSSIWNFSKTDKDLQLSFVIKSSFWSAIFSMNEISAGSIFILSTADALYCIRNNTFAITSAVLVRIWHLVMLTLWKHKPNTRRKSKSVPFSLSWQLKKPWFSFVPGFSVSADSRNYELMC